VKAKYKIGNLVETVSGVGPDTTSNFGKVEAIVTTDKGHAYRVSGTEFAESDILSAYRPIVPRQATKKVAKPRQATKKGKSEADVRATQ
jgi:hypothetical protein